MKHLTRIRLINWHLFENTTITCKGSTYFIGVNGVGKSTILDAVQFALIGGQREVKFNQAAMAGSQRSLTSYVRGELGTEGQRFLRGDTTAVVALEFHNPDESYFVHGAVIDAYQDGRSPDIAYFIVNNAPLNDAWFFRGEGQLFDSRAFRRHLEHFALPGPQARAQLFSRLEDYRFHLLNRLGQLKDTFPAKIVKGLAFTPLTNIRDFVHTYLLDENLVDVKTLREQLETMRHFETLAADIRQRIEALNQIETLDQERRSQRRLRLVNGYISRQAEGDAYLAELKRSRLGLDQAQVELSRRELQRDELAEALKYANNGLIEAQVALRADTTAIRKETLEKEIGVLKNRVAELRQSEQQLHQILSQEGQDLQRLKTFLVEDEVSVPEALTAFIEATAAPSMPQQLKILEALLPQLQADLQALSQPYADQQALLNNRSQQLRQEAAQAQREIQQLRTGDRAASYEAEAPQSSRLRRLLRADLGLNTDEVVPLYDVLEVPDESWQNAVEGILGRTRFDLLVPPQQYDAAMRLYRRRRLEDDLHGVGLPDTERILSNAQGRGPQPNSLAAEVKTAHPAARAFVDLLLGGYIKCDTLEDLRDYRTAVTRDCFVRRNFTSSHMNPRHYSHWFIGDRATPRQIEQREARLNGIVQELAALQQQETALRERLTLTRDKVRRYVELEHRLPLLANLPEWSEQLARLQAELAGLDTHSVAALQQEVQRREAEFNRLQKEAEALGEQIGGLKNRIQTLNKETLPGLERQADDALQAAKAFLWQEEAEDTLEEGQKEYERRRQRQPVETIRDNAGRYETDYQNAETRSRDKLRESKHSYSLTYEFGYDDEEDAARYLRERDRYVESELPQYEARIAEQRVLAEQELVENFIHRLREQIEDARQQLAYLNTTLAGLRFGGERFEFITKPEPSLRQVYDMVMDSQAVLGESLFASGFRQRHQQGWDLLFERLTAGPEGELGLELRELQDYRNYLQYDIRIHYANGERALLSQISAKKSGGETTTPFYVAMAASFAQAYRLNQPRPSDTIRLALFDEAFGKMDTARTASALKFMVENQLQVLLATPPDKAAGLLPHVDSVRTVVRQNNHAFVIEIDKAEMLKELEAA